MEQQASEETTMRECSAAFYFALVFHFSLGFIYFCTATPKASAGSCDNYQKYFSCNYTEGVNLSCFIKKPHLFYICEWKPRRDNSTTYILCIKRRHCKCVPVHQRNMISVSDGIRVLNTRSMTAYVVAKSEEHGSCIYQSFEGVPSQMTLCSPSSKVTFKRSSGNMTVQVDWEDKSSFIKQFLVKYRKFNSAEWKKQLSKNDRECDISNLASSLPYEVQIQCVPNEECFQCPHGEVFTVPQELMDSPSIQHEIQDHVQDLAVLAGQRKVIVEWKYATSEAVAYYNVTIRKVSGENSEQDSFATKDPCITLILSYSAYNISVRGLNSAGSSPAASITIENVDVWKDLFRPFNVNITSNNSFHLSWNISLSSVCYSVEWWARGQIPAFQSFYVAPQEAHRKITEITKNTFQPYTRYYFVLHTRLNKDTCNLKNVNESEVTYGTSQAYLTEGSPISAPGNVSILNITQHSAVIMWSPVPEEDLHGFLLGYRINYTEENTETVLTVNIMDSSLSSYELSKLKSNSAYRVQLAAFTAAGEGKHSDPKPFVTNPLEFTALNSIIAAVIVGIIIFLLAVHFSCRLLHRAKRLLWPSIPNPGNSNAVQKIEIGHELQDMFEPLNRQMLDESEGCDSGTVCVVESKEESKAALLGGTSASEADVKPSVLLSEDEGSTPTFEETITTDTPTLAPNEQSSPTENVPIDLDKLHPALRASEDSENEEPEDPSTLQTDLVPAAPVKPAVVFMSDYTTMEFFQQVSMAGIQGPSTAIQTGIPKRVSVYPEQDYVCQSCLSEKRQSNVSGACNGKELLHTEITVL